jgi:predicted RNA-binding protein
MAQEPPLGRTRCPLLLTLPGELLGGDGAVVEQEGDHVGLGEALGDGRQLVGAGLDLRAVDLALPLRSPELVRPADTVECLEGVRMQASQAIVQATLVLGASSRASTGLSGRKI